MTADPALSAPIVKLGGSLFGAPALDALLDVAVRHGALIVAGGGVFAESVRNAQQGLGFDDVAAHRMAIFAMEQGACLLAVLRPDFAICATLAEIREAARSRRPAIWSPSTLALAADVPASWDVTSDSLALWLALETGASRVALVKSTHVSENGDAESWAEAGIVDRHLPVLAARFAGELLCVGDASATLLEAALAAPAKVAA